MTELLVVIYEIDETKVRAPTRIRFNVHEAFTAMTGRVRIERQNYPPSRVCPQSPQAVVTCRLQAVITRGFLALKVVER